MPMGCLDTGVSVVIATRGQYGRLSTAYASVLSIAKARRRELYAGHPTKCSTETAIEQSSDSIAMRPEISYELVEQLTEEVDQLTRVDASRLSVEERLEVLLDEYGSRHSGSSGYQGQRSRSTW